MGISVTEILTDILNPLSMELLEGRFREGQTIRADARNGTIEFAAV